MPLGPDEAPPGSALGPSSTDGRSSRQRSRRATPDRVDVFACSDRIADLVSFGLGPDALSPIVVEISRP